MVPRRFVLSFLVITLACTSARVFKRPGLDRSFAPVPEDSVQVFEAFEDVPGEYIEIADIEGKGNFWLLSNEDDVYGEIVEQAAKLGANAVILQGYSEHSFGDRMLSDEAPSEGKGVAVRIFPADTIGSKD